MNKSLAKDQPYVDLGYARYVGSKLPSGGDQLLAFATLSHPWAICDSWPPKDPIQTCGAQNATQVTNSPIETITERIQFINAH